MSISRYGGELFVRTGSGVVEFLNGSNGVSTRSPENLQRSRFPGCCELEWYSSSWFLVIITELLAESIMDLSAQEDRSPISVN